MNAPTVLRPRRRRWLWILGLIVLSPLLAGLIWYVNVRVSNRSAVRRLEAKLRQRGEPLALGELAAKYAPVPDEQNAAVLLLRVWQAEQPEFWIAFVEGKRSLGKTLPRQVDPATPFIGKNGRNVPRTKALSPAGRLAAESYLLRQTEHMQDVRIALRRPQCRFPLQFTNGFDTLLPHLAQIKTEAQNFEIEALIAAEHGEADVAIEALNNALRAGYALVDEPYLISQLVRISCNLVAVNGAEQLLSRQQLSRAQLGKLRLVFEAARVTNAIALSLMGERAMFLSVFERPPASLTDADSGQGESSETPEEARRKYQMGMQFWKNIGLADTDKRLMLETFDRATTLSEQNTSESITQWEQMFRSIRQRGFGFPPTILSRLLLPSLSGVLNRFASLESRRRAAVTAFAVESYRNDRGGNLPKHLDQLMLQYLDAIPSDPFDDQPIKFRVLAKGFVVYSIGPDRTDDEGKERPIKLTAKGFDETFTVER